MKGKNELSINGNIFEYISEQVNIIDVVQNFVALEQAGQNHKGLCPFHNEKTPSFVVSEEKQLYHCFGCGASGNVIQFVMNHQNLDAIDAVDWLADRYHVDLTEFKKNKNITSQNAKLYDILRDAAIFFYKNLRKHERALHYLENRHIDYRLIKTFGLGFASDQWSELMDHMLKKYTETELLSVGLLSQNKEKKRCYDRFRNRLIFPIINPKGKVIGFGGRVLDDSLPKYLNSPETEVFNKSATLYGLHLAKNNPLSKNKMIVAEGYMDVIALHKYGFSNAVATLGTAMTSEHAKLLKRYTSEVVICYDSDPAGQKAALKSLDILENTIEKVSVVMLGDGMDPDDYLSKFGTESFQEKIEQAMLSREYRINALRKQFDLNDEGSKVSFLSQASAIISTAKNSFEKNLLIEKLGYEMNVNTDMIANEVYKGEYYRGKNYRFNQKEALAPTVSKKSKDKKAYLEKQIITCVLHQKSCQTESVIKTLESTELSSENDPLLRKALEHVKAYGKLDQDVLMTESNLALAKKLSELNKEASGDVDQLDIQLIIQNLLLLSVDDEINHLVSLLKKTDNPKAIQLEILKKRQEKQSILMNIKGHKNNE